MTPEDQRIAIAEACGWSMALMTHRSAYWMGPNGEMFGQGQFPPDYLNDLNAMHEAETVALKTVGWMTYGEQLFKVTDSKDINVGPLFHATAAQRAEAFLKAIGKWE